MPLPSERLRAHVAVGAERAARRVFPVEIDGETIWIKRSDVPQKRARVGYAVLRLLGFLMRRDILRPRTEPGGPASLRREAELLRELAAGGVRVPPVVALEEEASWLALGSIGESLGRVAARENDPRARRELLLGAAHALAALHAAGFVHGAPLPRNLCVDGEGAERRFGFLDFEDHTAGRMDLDKAQARDALLFTWGAASWAPSDAGLLVELIEEWKKSAPEAAWREARSHARLGRWVLAPLGPIRGVLGKDLRRAVDARAAWRAVC